MKDNLIYFPDVWQDDMEDLMNRYTVQEIREIVKLHEIPGTHNYRKAELVTCVVKNILDEEYMHRYFMLAANEELDLFEQMINDELDEDTSEERFMFGYFIQGGYVFVDEEGTILIPEEVRKAYQKIHTPEFYEEHKLFETAYCYCLGMVNIFGAVSLEMITEFYNKYEENKLTKDQMFSEIFIPSLMRFRNIRYSGDMLVESFMLQEKGILEQILTCREVFTGYVPTRRDIWKSAKYVEESLMIFGNYIMDEMKLPVQNALGLSELISYMLKIGTSPDEVFRLVQEEDLTFLNQKQADRFLKELRELWLNTRLYTTYGHTPKEIEGKDIT